MLHVQRVEDAGRRGARVAHVSPRVHVEPVVLVRGHSRDVHHQFQRWSHDLNKRRTKKFVRVICFENKETFSRLAIMQTYFILNVCEPQRTQDAKFHQHQRIDLSHWSLRHFSVSYHSSINQSLTQRGTQTPTETKLSFSQHNQAKIDCVYPSPGNSTLKAATSTGPKNLNSQKWRLSGTQITQDPILEFQP